MAKDNYVDYNNLTAKQKKAIKILNMLWENGVTHNNFTGDHSEYSTMIIEICKII